jgi:hypothetical protein
VIFGSRDLRLGLLESEEKDEMEKYVTLKLEYMKTRVLAWEPDEYSRHRHVSG